MSIVIDRIPKEENAFTGSVEAIETAKELERRRLLVERGERRLLTEDESWTRIRSAGYDV